MEIADQPWGRAELRRFLIEVRITITRVCVFTALLALSCAAFLWGTALTMEFWRLEGVSWATAPQLQKYLFQSNLSTEDVVAVWFSSMLLLLVALAAVICFATESRTGPMARLRFGWLIVAVIFAGLSLDELGSLHERLSLFDGAIGWLLWMGPFILVIPVYMMMFGWVQIKRSKAAFGLVVAGVICFSSIPIHEFVEIVVLLASNGPSWERPISHILFEEGTELLGMICFLVACILSAWAISSQKEKEVLRVRTVTIAGPLPLLLGIIVLTSLAFAAAMLASASSFEPERLTGTPENWFPSSAAFISSLAALQLASQSNYRLTMLTFVLVAAVALSASAFLGSDLHHFGTEYRKLRLMIMGLLAIISLLVIFMRGLSAIERTGYVVWAVLLAIMVTTPIPELAGPALLGGSMVLLLVIACGFATYGKAVHLARRPAIGESFRI